MINVYPITLILQQVSIISFLIFVLPTSFHNPSPMFTGKGPFVSKPDIFSGCKYEVNTDEKA